MQDCRTGLPGGSVVKNLPGMQTRETQEAQVQTLSQEDPVEEGTTTHSSILAWEIHGQRRLAGYSPWGRKGLDTTESTEYGSMYHARQAYKHDFKFVDKFVVCSLADKELRSRRPILTASKTLTNWKVNNSPLSQPRGEVRRRQWQPTPVLLPGKSHRRRSLVGCSPWGCQESDMTGRLHFHFSLSCIGEGNSNPLQRSCLESPRNGGAWWAAVYGVTRGRTQLKQLSCSNSSRGEVTGQTAAFPKLETLRGEYRRSWLTGAETHKPQPSREPMPGQGNLNCHGPKLNWIPGASVWTSLRVRNSREAQSWRGWGRVFWALREFLPPGDLLGSHREEQSKLSECFSRGGKSNHCAIFQTLLSINQGCPQERLVNLSLTCWGFIRPRWPAGGNTQLQPTILCHLRDRLWAKKHIWSSWSRVTGSPRPRPLPGTPAHSPPTTTQPHHRGPNDLLTAVPSTQLSMSTTKKKFRIRW